MKRPLKQMARRLWQMSAPVRQPLVRKFDDHMIQLLVTQTLVLPPAAPAELDLAVTSVVRELGRLQMQVEVLQQQIDDLQSSDRDKARIENRLLVVGEMG